MRTLPILFNTEMVQAILYGLKTCTRRLVKFLPGENPKWTGYVKDGLMLYNGKNEPCIREAPYQPGDIMYVRETWGEGYEEGTYIYKADDKLANLPAFKESSKILYHPFIHMPKEAARIWLKITDVRVERLQDITYNGALREGAQGIRCDHVALGEHGCTDCMNTGWIEPPVVEFMQIWDSTIKKSDIDRYGWDANPWVWVVEFERCEKPELT